MSDGLTTAIAATGGAIVLALLLAWFFFLPALGLMWILGWMS